MSDAESAAPLASELDAPGFPTETEIYLLPDGRVVIADLPAELGALVERVGASLEQSTATEERYGQTD